MQTLAFTLIHFIWQGALIVCIYTLLRRHIGPQFRYVLACGSLLAMAAAPVATFLLLTPHETASPALGVVPRIVSPDSAVATNGFLPSVHAMQSDATNWIVLAWLLGVAVFSARLLGGWILAVRMRSRLTEPASGLWQRRLDSLRTRMRVTRQVRLLASSAIQVPVVVGWLRPVVMVPVAAFTGMDVALVEALIAHELTHIRRHDYLINVLQGVIEAVLFYHPAVWWISRQIRMERELCCDDAAVSICGSTLTYVRALSEVEACRPCHRNPVLAANGGSLATRISRLLGITPPSPRGGVAGLAAAIILIGVLASYAQQPIVSAASLPAFEVASIHPSDPDTSLKVDFAPGGRLDIEHATLRFLIKIAYDVGDDQIVGGPAWIGSTRFDVQGKPPVAIPGDPQAMTKEQVLVFHEPTRLRLQRLLADRFQLELRKESKAMPIFALVPAKNGTKLKRSSTTGDMEVSFAHGILTAKRMDMASLARFLSEGQVGRPVVDATALPGKYDLRLEWEPDPSLDPTQAGNQQTAGGGGVSVFTAVQQQLGLRLEARTSSADALVVARAELPSAN